MAWVLAVLTGFSLLSWAVSATRNRTNVAATAMVDLFLGWTLVGWVVALVTACGTERLPPGPTRVDPLGVGPTQQLPRSPWEPDHRR